MLFRILKWKLFLVVGFLAFYGLMAMLPGADGQSWERHDLSQAQIDNNQVTMTAADDGSGSIVFSFEPALGSLYGVKCDGIPGMFTNRMVGDARSFHHTSDLSSAKDDTRPIFGAVLGAIQNGSETFRTITSLSNQGNWVSGSYGTTIFLPDNQTNWNDADNSRPREDYTQKKLYMYVKVPLKGGERKAIDMMMFNQLSFADSLGKSNYTRVDRHTPNSQTPHMFWTVTDIDDKSSLRFIYVWENNPTGPISISHEYTYWFKFLPQDYTTFRVMQSTILVGNDDTDVVTFSDVQKGDIAFITTTLPGGVEIGVNRLMQYIDLKETINKVGGGFNQRADPYDELERFIVAFTSDYDTYDLIEPHGDDDYSVAIHIRPVWKLEPLGGLYNPDQVMIPKYLLTNYSTLHCVGYAFDNVIFDNDFYFRQSNAVTIPIAAYCRPDDSFTLPKSILSGTLGLTWDDIRPNNYCNFSPTAPVPNIPKPGPGNGTEGERLYADLLSYDFGSYNNPPRDNVLFVRLTDTYVWNTNSAGACHLKDDLSNTVYESRALAADTRASVWFKPINETAPVDISKLAPLTIVCNDLSYKRQATTDNFTLNFQRTIPASEPYFQLITADLDDDVFGWGIGTDEFGFSNNIMGMSFMGIMILFSAIAGFQRFNLPASLIIFLGIHGAAMYLELVPIEHTIISGIIVLAILGIFSKGIR